MNVSAPVSPADDQPIHSLSDQHEASSQLALDSNETHASEVASSRDESSDPESQANGFPSSSRDAATGGDAKVDAGGGDAKVQPREDENDATTGGDAKVQPRATRAKRRTDYPRVTNEGIVLAVVELMAAGKLKTEASGTEVLPLETLCDHLQWPKDAQARGVLRQRYSILRKGKRVKGAKDIEGVGVDLMPPLDNQSHAGGCRTDVSKLQDMLRSARAAMDSK